MRTFSSFAKLNLHLAVVGRRGDGFHELLTLFQTIDLADRLRIGPRRRPGIELSVHGGGIPADSRNLAWRAAEGFFAAFPEAPFAGVRIELEKGIPAGAGLGGGSSDAATVLLALAGLAELDTRRAGIATRLHALAEALGADVPFFLVGGTAVGRGRGDRLEALPDLLRPLSGGRTLMLAIPPFPLSTAEVFARCSVSGEPADLPVGVAALAAGAPVSLENLIGRNDLEAPAFAVRPALGALYTALVDSGAERVRMSGSGSTIFALYADPETAAAAGRRLPSGTVWRRVSPLGRDAWRAAGGQPVSGGGE